MTTQKVIKKVEHVWYIVETDEHDDYETTVVSGPHLSKAAAIEVLRATHA